MADLEGHVHEGVVVLPVGHAPGVQAHRPAADAAQREHARGAQAVVNLFEQAGQVGLGLEVVGVLGDEVGHPGLLGAVRRGRWR